MHSIVCWWKYLGSKLDHTNCKIYFLIQGPFLTSFYLFWVFSNESKLLFIKSIAKKFILKYCPKIWSPSSNLAELHNFLPKKRTEMAILVKSKKIASSWYSNKNCIKIIFIIPDSKWNWLWCSVTRWQIKLFIIWLFAAIKISPKAYKICQN